MADMLLAQANIAIFRWPLDDPRMSKFAAAIQPVNELAERADGFVWRFTESYVPRDVGPPWDNPLLFFNMSVWRDLDSLLAFVRSSDHVAIMSDRTEWCLPVSCPSSAQWWIEETTRPTVEDAMEAISRIASGRADSP